MMKPMLTNRPAEMPCFREENVSEIQGVNKAPQLNRMKGKISHGYQLHSKRPACWFDGPADP